MHIILAIQNDLAKAESLVFNTTANLTN